MDRTQRMVVSLRNLKTQLQTEMGKGDSAGGSPSPPTAIQEVRPVLNWAQSAHER